MAEKLTARANLVIKAEPAAVWAVIMDPDLVSQAFFGAEVKTDWQEGGPITFSGEWEGKRFEDKGDIVKVEQDKMLQFTHFSPMSGQPDIPENYHLVTFNLAAKGNGTEVTITQNNAASESEQKHSQENWALVLNSIKELAER